MKSTGIVRKVDELGRIVLPIELRRTLSINEKDALEIFVDNDKIEITNLNRQLLALQNNIGNYKVDEAEIRKNTINPDCKITKIQKFINQDNIDELFKYKIDFLIDAQDTMITKKLLIKNCIERNVDFITAIGLGNRMNGTKVQIMDLKNTAYDPVAKILRQYIRKEKINKKIVVVGSSEKPIKSKVIGSNSFVPAIAGLLCGSYAINKILKENKNGENTFRKN
mgnify:CR=1 FL=1